MPPSPTDPAIIQNRLQVGQRIRTIRLRRNLTQEALAHAAGIGRYTVVRAELGLTSLNVDNAYRLARTLDVPLAWLFEDHDISSLG